MPAVALLRLATVLACVVFSRSSVAQSTGDAEAHAGREVVSFNKAWRFHRGDPSNAEDDCAPGIFARRIEHATCAIESLTFVPVGLSNHDAEECRKACCSGLYLKGRCVQWMLLDKNATGHADALPGCYLASAAARCDTSVPGPWNGAIRPTTPTPPVTYEYATASFNASAWEAIDAPHDFVLRGSFAPNERDSGHGYLPRDGAGWYRKNFRVPDEWKNQRVVLEFDGVFHVSRIWLNGVELAVEEEGGEGNRNGYTGFTVRIDAHLEHGTVNTLAVRADASFGSGHWYEGGGIIRNVRIVKTDLLHLVPRGIAAQAQLASPLPLGAVNLTARVQNARPEPADVSLCVSLIDDTTGSMVVESSFTQYVNIPSGSSRQLQWFSDLNAQVVATWSIQSPATYTLRVLIVQRDYREMLLVVDAVNTTIGFREATFTTSGFFLNSRHTVLRGFSDHNSFAGVGAAVPARINLYKAQMLRACGGNFWRMSHNPPDPVLLDILDVLGILVWDETRDFTLAQVRDMADLVRRDFNHPSVVMWSMGNEVELHDPTGQIAVAMRKAILALDGSRPISANMNKPSSDSVARSLDVQGVSHCSVPGTPSSLYRDVRYSFPWLHEQEPTKPIVSSEGTTCVTQRGVNFVDVKHVLNNEWEPSFNGDCISKRLCPADRWVNQQNYDGGCAQSWTLVYNETGSILPYVAGTLGVWTLFDYLGEPMSYRRKAELGSAYTCWPQVSSSYGSFDLAGFVKPGAWHYRAWWLCDVDLDDAGRPPVSTTSCSTDRPVVQIVQDWRSDPAPPPTIAVYTNAPRAELLRNGHSLGQCTMRFADYCEWNVSFSPGNLTAVALSETGAVLSSDTRLSPGAPTAVALSIDAPSLATGTGEALFADGQDVALVRASLVDQSGRLCSAASHNVSFSVVSGPGRVVGVGNGDPFSHEPNAGSSRLAYHGLARVVVQVTVDTASEGHVRATMIDVDAVSAHVVEDIVVVASAPGLREGRVTIPVSASASDSVLAVARRSVEADIQLP